jgi:predicted permease
MLSDFLFRLRAAFRRETVEEELDDELRFHLEQEVAKRMAAGMERPEALREARLALGGLDQVKEECREARGISALETTLRDARYAIRGMSHSPAFTVAAILTLGFGTAAVSTVFTLANTMFFRELPADRPDRLVFVQASRSHGRRMGWVGYPDYVHFRDHAKTLEGLAAHYATAPLFVNSASRSEEINGAVVSANFFPLLGVQPALGRLFRPDEDSVPDRDRVAVISDRFWRDWFNASPAALGATLKINGTVFTIIGVAPPAFRGITVYPNEIYIPTMMMRVGCRWCVDALSNGCATLDMIGRLRDNYTVAEAGAEMAASMPQSWLAAKEGENSGIRVLRARGVLDLNTGRSGQIRFTELLACVAGVLLLVCCANLAGLLVARNSARTREFAIRASLGAGRLRLIRQLVTESVLLAAGGGVLGMLFSLALTGVLNATFYSINEEGHPLYYNFSPEFRVIAAVVAVSIVAGILAGIIPAFKSIRARGGDSLIGQSSPMRANSRLGRGLAGAQAGVAVALATIAGLLATSARAVIAGANFDTSHVALMRLRPRLLRYPPDRAQRVLRTVADRLETAPGVESASMVGTGAILFGRDAQVSLRDWADSRTIDSRFIEVGPRYFETLGTPVLRGREFDQRDTIESPPVAIVSEALARQLWPTGNVVGATLIVNQQPRQVVGVVADIPLETRGEPVPPFVFTPFWQNAAQLDARFLVRVKGDPKAMLPELIRLANRVDPDVPIGETITLPAQMAGVNLELRYMAGFVSFAAALAILLSAIGLYGALAFSVSRRTKEIGIRMALGAESTTLLAMVMRDGMTAILAGVSIGVVLAIGGSSVIRHLLYGSGTNDAMIYVAAALVVAGAGLLACWVPARRAASVEPLTALREQ